MLAQMPGYASSRSERSARVHALFSAGQQGALYDPSDLSTLFQDAAGTTPVTADGEPVGLMRDVSGNAHHDTQFTAARRPLYRTGGGLHWLESDGVDDTLGAIGFRDAGAGSRSITVGYQPLVSTGVGGLAGWNGPPDNSTWYQLHTRDAPAGDPYFAGYNDDLTDGTAKNTAKKVGMIRNDDTAYELLRNNVVIATGTKTITVVDNDFVIGKAGPASNYARIKFFGAAVTLYYPSALQSNKINEYIAKLCGVTL